jgi:hypothetical protein
MRWTRSQVEPTPTAAEIKGFFNDIKLLQIATGPVSKENRQKSVT